PVRHAARLDASRALLVLGIDRFDQKRPAIARADTAAEGLLRGHGRIALPEERLHDDRRTARRAARAVELAHRDAMRRADERRIGDTLERDEELVRRRRHSDDIASPRTEGLSRARDPAATDVFRGVGSGPGERERIEDESSLGRIRRRERRGESFGERAAEALERSREWQDLDRREREHPLPRVTHPSPTSLQVEEYGPPGIRDHSDPAS